MLLDGVIMAVNPVPSNSLLKSVKEMSCIEGFLLQFPRYRSCNFDWLLGTPRGVCYQFPCTFCFSRHLNESFKSFVEISTLGAAGLCHSTVNI